MVWVTAVPQVLRRRDCGRAMPLSGLHRGIRSQSGGPWLTSASGRKYDTHQGLQLLFQPADATLCCVADLQKPSSTALLIEAVDLPTLRILIHRRALQPRNP